jgi:hypothetical protein
MAQTVKIVPYTYMHGNHKVDAFRVVAAVDGHAISGPLNKESAIEYTKSHGFVVEVEDKSE